MCLIKVLTVLEALYIIRQQLSRHTTEYLKAYPYWGIIKVTQVLIQLLTIPYVSVTGVSQNHLYISSRHKLYCHYIVLIGFSL